MCVLCVIGVGRRRYHSIVCHRFSCSFSNKPLLMEAAFQGRFGLVSLWSNHSSKKSRNRANGKDKPRRQRQEYAALRTVCSVLWVNDEDNGSKARADRIESMEATPCSVHSAFSSFLSAHSYRIEKGHAERGTGMGVSSVSPSLTEESLEKPIERMKLPDESPPLLRSAPLFPSPHSQTN